jgi:hypothetical protein
MFVLETLQINIYLEYYGVCDSKKYYYKTSF